MEIIQRRICIKMSRTFLFFRIVMLGFHQLLNRQTQRSRIERRRTQKRWQKVIKYDCGRRSYVTEKYENNSMYVTFVRRKERFAAIWNQIIIDRT
jgi:hypothetical protein